MAVVSLLVLSLSAAMVTASMALRAMRNTLKRKIESNTSMCCKRVALEGQSRHYSRIGFELKLLW